MIMQVSTVRTVDASIEFTIIEIEYIIIPHESGAENQMSSGAEILGESKGGKEYIRGKKKWNEKKKRKKTRMHCCTNIFYNFTHRL